jgi:hypothetical protein
MKSHQLSIFYFVQLVFVAFAGVDTVNEKKD